MKVEAVCHRRPSNPLSVIMTNAACGGLFLDSRSGCGEAIVHSRRSQPGFRGLVIAP